METIPTAEVVPRFDHLLRMSNEYGVLEHALGDQPRLEHGLCTDDNARVVVVLCRAEHLSPDEVALLDRSLDFVLAGRVPGGWRNRRHVDGDWLDRHGPDDAHGRALWGLGVAARRHGDESRRLAAAKAFAEGADLASPHPRARAYAVLGAVDALEATSAAPAAERVIAAAAERWAEPLTGAWRWPEERLTYANARIPEAMIASGVATGDDTLVSRGVELLEWLAITETGLRGFSFTPVGGRGPGERGPAFDQQPIEAWAMADACARAAAATGEAVWQRRRIDAVAWFLGRNDGGAVLYDTDTGAGHDGLTADGVNANRGAESTLAALGALLAERVT